MKIDMSPEAITRRWRKVAELVQVCRALRIKPGSVRPVVGAVFGLEYRPRPLGGSDALTRQAEKSDRPVGELPEP